MNNEDKDKDMELKAGTLGWLIYGIVFGSVVGGFSYILQEHTSVIESGTPLLLLILYGIVIFLVVDYLNGKWKKRRKRKGE